MSNLKLSSSRRPRCVPPVSYEHQTEATVSTGSAKLDNRRFFWSDSLFDQDHGSILPCIKGSGCCCWCRSVRGICGAFWAHLCPVTMSVHTSLSIFPSVTSKLEAATWIRRRTPELQWGEVFILNCTESWLYQPLPPRQRLLRFPFILTWVAVVS